MCRRMPLPRTCSRRSCASASRRRTSTASSCPGPIVVGEVLEFVEEPQSNGKTIRWCQVRVAPDGETAADGGPAVHGIVCGARNFFVGDKVAVTLPGAVLPGPFPIAARKTYGHVSDGMIASAQGARARRRARRHPAAGRARHRRPGRHRRDRAARPGRRRGRDQRDARPRLRAVDPRRRARVLARDRRGLPRSRAAAAARGRARPAASRSPSTTSAPIRGRVGASEFVVRVVRGVDAVSPDARVDDRAAHARRHPLARRAHRHHELRDARARQADPRLRPRQARRRHHRAPRDAGGEARDARRQGAHARPRGPADHRRVRARSAWPA